MPDKSLVQELVNQMDAFPVIDTHEHNVNESDYIAEKMDVCKLLCFAPYLISSGMSEKDVEECASDAVPLERRWEKLKPYLEHIKCTPGYLCARAALRDLYGFDDIADNNYRKISERLQRERKKGFYRKIIKDRCNIAAILNNVHHLDYDRKWFTLVMYTNRFYPVYSRAYREQFEKEYGVALHSLRDLERYAERTIAEWKKLGVVAIKFTKSYWLVMRTEKVTRADAERLFNRSFEHLGEGFTDAQAKPLVDYMIHFLIQLAVKHDLPVAFHTGFQASGKNIITNSNPADLANIFLEYKDARFDIFHCGYPYMREAAVMAKYFPNVCVNFCWQHLISPRAYRQALSEYLEIVPSNKIFGFGEAGSGELLYGGLVIAKRGIAWALAEKIEEGAMNEKEAITLARKLLYENPRNFYRLELKG